MDELVPIPPPDILDKARAKVDLLLKDRLGEAHLRTALVDAEINFAMNPHATFHGGTPRILLRRDGEEWPCGMMEVPEHWGDQDMLWHMWRLLDQQGVDCAVYHYAGKSDKLCVFVMSRKALWECQTQMSCEGDQYTLADWTLTKHVRQFQHSIPDAKDR